MRVKTEGGLIRRVNFTLYLVGLIGQKPVSNAGKIEERVNWKGGYICEDMVYMLGT